mmetsp:Transcript_36663/g.97051  ORF Transcript_36663/g.97051 Transcript_36663/m.97051 type:complete len:237 (+) Transcript_36663:1821-2531(+)
MTPSCDLSASLSPTRSPLSGVGIDLNAAKPGTIVNTASLEGLSHAVYTMTVQGAKVYSGLYNGNIQVWHMDAYVNLPSGSRPEYHTLTGHTSSVYALVVTERQLISASHDKLVKIWDMNTLRCRHTLKGHNSRVRALALAGKLLFSGSNDKSIKVWNLEMVSQTQVDKHGLLIKSMCREMNSIQTIFPFSVSRVPYFLDPRTGERKGRAYVCLERQHSEGVGSQDHEVHLHVLHRL